MLTIFFILIWILLTILFLRFFYVSNPPQKVNTIYVGLDHNEWNVILKCIDQCIKSGPRSDADYEGYRPQEEEERIAVGREIAYQVCNHIESELK